MAMVMRFLGATGGRETVIAISVVMVTQNIIRFHVNISKDNKMSSVRQGPKQGDHLSGHDDPSTRTFQLQHQVIHHRHRHPVGTHNSHKNLIDGVCELLDTLVLSSPSNLNDEAP